METEEIEKLLDTLDKFGLKDKELEAKILQEVNLGTPGINIVNNMDFLEDRVRYAVHIQQDVLSGSLHLDGIYATYLKPVGSKNPVINKVNIPELENRLKFIDWESYFKGRISNTLVIDFAKNAMKDLWNLASDKNEDGASVKAMLVMKYFPRRQWDDEKQDLMYDLYKDTVYIRESENWHVNRFYLEASGKINTLTEQLDKLRLDEDCKIDYHQQLNEKITNLPEGFALNFQVNTPEAFAQLRMPVTLTNEGNYSLDEYKIILRAYPIILYGDTGTQALEKEMQQIDWRDDNALFATKAWGGVEYKSRVGKIVDKLEELNNNEDSKEIAILLKLKYLTGSFLEQDFDKATQDYLKALPKQEMIRRNDIPVKAAINLLLGRPVLIPSEKGVRERDATWEQLLPVENYNYTYSKFYKDFPVSEVERMLQLLPIPDAEFHAVKAALLTGDIARTNLFGDVPVTIHADPENKTLHVYNAEYLEIPVNFRLESGQFLLDNMKEKTQKVSKTSEQHQSTLQAFKQRPKGQKLRL